MEVTKGIHRSWTALIKPKPLGGAFFWLLFFFFVYCARPEDWIPGLGLLPLAKISGVFIVLALGLSVGRSERGIRDLPREVFYLLLLIGQLLVSALLSPVWRGGAISHTLDFAKVLVVVVATMLIVTRLSQLRQLLTIQAGSVAFIAFISLAKGHSLSRLSGALGGTYSNPNDLAMAIDLTLPLCFALLLATRSIVQKAAWMTGMSVMLVALLFTGSRAGFIALVIVGVLSLWHFGIRGRRPLMIVAAFSALVVASVLFGGKVKERFAAMSGENIQTDMQSSAYSSYEARKFVMEASLDIIGKYPFFGLGLGNFQVYTRTWSDVHNAFLQIASEGGIPALILYVLFFWRAFVNLRHLRRKRSSLDSEAELYAGALQATLIAFVAGATFAPVAYEFFPFFTAAYTWVLLAIADKPQESTWVSEAALPKRPWRQASICAETSTPKPHVLAR